MAGIGWVQAPEPGDRLRTHPGDAAEYGRLKTLLAAADAHDRPRYRAAKAPFIEDLLKHIESSDTPTRDL